MAQKQAAAPVYKREDLLKSKAFSHVQQDFLKAILQRDSYTMEEAQKAIADFFAKESGQNGRRHLDNAE